MGKLGMIKSITQGMLGGAMGLAGWLLRTGERMAALADRLGADEAYDLKAPYAEIWMHNRGETVTAMGVLVENLVDRLGGVQGIGAN